MLTCLFTGYADATLLARDSEIPSSPDGIEEFEEHGWRVWNGSCLIDRPSGKKADAGRHRKAAEVRGLSMTFS